jgi:alkylated DNA nucleotide flippase Atl1
LLKVAKSVPAIRLALIPSNAFIGLSVACPIVTGIHARIAAGAAGENEADGKKRITPYWRTLKGNGEVNAKYPGGLSGQRRRLEREGLEVVDRGDRLFVRDYEKSLVKLP